MMIYKIMKFLKNESVCRRIEEKYEKTANEEAEKIPNDRKCKKCSYGRFVKAENILACGYECNLNPLKPIAVGGFAAEHSSYMTEINRE